MASSSVGAVSVSRTHERVSWALLAGLLFLRLPFLAGIALFSTPAWLEPTFQIGTYLLTAFLVWWERERLADFHIDGVAVWILILFKPAQTVILKLWPVDSPLAFPKLPGLSLWATAAALLIAAWLSRSKFPRIRPASFGWFAIGIGAGIVTAVLLAYPLSLQGAASQLPPRSMILAGLAPAAIIPHFIYQLGYAAVSEEPLFRGFLWGYLRKAGWQEVWIWLFQAGLFMIGHMYYLKNALISFWIIVPIGALVYGWVAWRSRSITASMAAHATLNTVLPILGLLVASYRY